MTAAYKSLGLIRIELQTVLQVPLPDVSSTGGEDSQTVGGVVGVHGQLELCVVGVLVKLDAVLCDDVSHRAAVHSKQLWAEY